MDLQRAPVELAPAVFGRDRWRGTVVAALDGGVPHPFARNRARGLRRAHANHQRRAAAVCDVPEVGAIHVGSASLQARKCDARRGETSEVRVGVQGARLIGCRVPAGDARIVPAGIHDVAAEAGVSARSGLPAGARRVDAGVVVARRRATALDARNDPSAAGASRVANAGYRKGCAVRVDAPVPGASRRRGRALAPETRPSFGPSHRNRWRAGIARRARDRGAGPVGCDRTRGPASPGRLRCAGRCGRNARRLTSAAAEPDANERSRGKANPRPSSPHPDRFQHVCRREQGPRHARQSVQSSHARRWRVCHSAAGPDRGALVAASGGWLARRRAW